MSAQPYLVIDPRESDPDYFESPHHMAVLEWLRAEGIDPEKGNRCEVYEGDPPYAIVSLFELDENGHKILDEVTDALVTYTDIVKLTSLPPVVIK